jgi:hypothetical protein
MENEMSETENSATLDGVSLKRVIPLNFLEGGRLHGRGQGACSEFGYFKILKSYFWADLAEIVIEPREWCELFARLRVPP